MKINLTLEERKYLGALIKILAINTKDQPGALAFWRSIYEQLAPNRPTADLRQKEVESLLAICQKGLQSMKDLRTQDEAGAIRVAALEEVLLRVEAKISARIKEVRQDERANERRDGEIPKHDSGEKQ